MKLFNGIYKTKAGSTVKVSGFYSGISEVEFDWLEEQNACIDCHVNAYAVDGFLTWNCEECGGGEAELFLVPKE